MKTPREELNDFANNLPRDMTWPPAPAAKVVTNPVLRYSQFKGRMPIRFHRLVKELRPGGLKDIGADPWPPTNSCVSLRDLALLMVNSHLLNYLDIYSLVLQLKAKSEYPMTKFNELMHLNAMAEEFMASPEYAMMHSSAVSDLLIDMNS